MKITIFGDSLTNGYDAATGAATDILKCEIESRMPELSVTLRGVNGEDTYNALKRLSIVASEPSDKILIFLGTNDSSNAYEINTEEYAINLRKIVQAFGVEKTLFVTPAYFNETIENPFRSNKLVELYRAKMLILSEEFELPVVDLYQAMKESENPSVLLQFDGLHLSDKGYRLLATLIVEFFRKRK